MKKMAYLWAFTALAFAVFSAGLAPRVAAQDTAITGLILDLNGKPWGDLGVTVVSDQGAKQETKTDKDGKYAFHNLRPGVYNITVQLPNQVFQGGQIKLQSGQQVPADFNFKDIVAKQNPQYAE